LRAHHLRRGVVLVPDRFLVFADPPHPSPDAKAIAAVLGILPMEVRGKLGYPFPEPWIVSGDAAEARSASERLVAAGVRTAVVPLAGLASVPEACVVKDFTLSPEGLEWSTRGGKARGSLLWREMKLAVSYRRTIEVEAGGHAGPDKPRGFGATKLMANMVVPVIGGAIVGKLAGGGGKQAPKTQTLFEESIEVAGVD